MDAGTPPGLGERIRQIAADEVAKFMRSGLLRNASISGGKGLTVKGGGGITVDGGALRVRGLPAAQPGATGDSTVYMGGITPALPDGTLQPGLVLRREDGTIALALYDPTPDNTGDGFNQFLALYDRAQVIVVSDDTASGQGLSRPYVPIPVTRARYTDMVAVTDSAFVDVFRTPGAFHKVNARARADIRCTTDVAGTTGEVRVLVDGVQVGDVQPVGFTVETKYVGPFAIPGDAYTTHSIVVQARRTAGTGAVRLDAAVWGVQS
ncbi:hypothetical protein [Blastococcus sp. TBT05-19]|uniref:hypothetical protein n=1 Tax=Blastococcus sp. TBT05-19 TaxID=2250581 RepID=UPI001313F7CA|nr:hypothetical protein [Blastococcus sp. TBT05-19]